MKIIAFYLPQFHNIPENDKWWGEGFTEWTNVKAAKPVYKGHIQPKIPLNNNYYNLLDDDVKIWQAHLAKKYGIYGFCYYHYWFNGKMLLEKPMEQMLKNKNVDIPFCICWANEPWTQIWVGKKKILYPQKYGREKEWKDHFEYFLPFMKDSRYITKDGKPILFIYKPDIIPCLSEMVSYWRKCAKNAGLNGITVLGRYVDINFMNSDQFKCLDYIVEWQPNSIKGTQVKKNSKNPLKVIRRNAYDFISRKFGVDAYQFSPIVKFRSIIATRIENYDDVWEKIIKMKPTCPNSIPGAFVRWDNSPRFGRKATIIKGETPNKFKKYLSMQIVHAKKDYKEDMMFLFAWNEWAEGGYLEPDEKNGYAYLKAIREALRYNNEA